MRSTLQYNFQGESHVLTTAFNIERWNYYLADYSDSIVTQFVQFCWPINYTSSQLPRSVYCKISSGLDWIGFVKHGFVKDGFVKGRFVKGRFVKVGFVKGGFVKGVDL